MIFGSHVEFGGHFDYSLQCRLRYSQETTIFFFPEIIFYFIIIGLRFLHDTPDGITNRSACAYI